jgi:hypothetical protein
MKIHLLSANSGMTTGAQCQREKLAKLWSLSSRNHELTDCAEEADIVLVSDLAGPNWFWDLRANTIVNRYPEKCFAVSDSDYPFPLLHGIYTSATNKLPFKTRFRSAGYNLYPDNYLNPYIKDHPGDAYKNHKKYLYSFSGRDSSPVRLKLFKLQKNKDGFICDSTKQFAAFGSSPEPKETWQKDYVRVLNESKYALCPRGVGATSLRLFESMKMGVAPVILSDKWLYPVGPAWKDFAIMLREYDVSRVHDILNGCESEYVQRGKLARKAYEEYFSENVYFDYLVDLCSGIQNTQKIPERFFWSLRNALISIWKTNRNLFVP